MHLVDMADLLHLADQVDVADQVDLTTSFPFKKKKRTFSTLAKQRKVV